MQIALTLQPLIRNADFVNNPVVMKLYVFNPSHDEALAAASPYYYPTRIARRLAVKWSMLPGIWASPGDAVWVDDGVTDEQLSGAAGPWCSGVRFVRCQAMTPAFWQEVESVEPWGWDPLIHRQLLKAGAPASLLPDARQLDRLRQLSSRRTTCRVLPELVSRLTAAGVSVVGQSRVAVTPEEAEQTLQEWNDVMVKSLWSCSGRGVFRLTGEPKEQELHRLSKLLREQGGVELQPYYEGLFDFALEFRTAPDGSTRYLGPSLFRTLPSGGYSGNLICPQQQLEQEIAVRVGGKAVFDLLTDTCCTVLSACFKGHYAGLSGIDMMVVRVGDRPFLFPCVEVNVRRTMGHVALNLIKRTLKADDLPPELRKLWYFCTP